MICPNCQTENRDSAKFCDECGQALKTQENTLDSAIDIDASDPSKTAEIPSPVSVENLNSYTAPSTPDDPAFLDDLKAADTQSRIASLDIPKLEHQGEEKAEATDTETETIPAGQTSCNKANDDSNVSDNSLGQENDCKDCPSSQDSPENEISQPSESNVEAVDACEDAPFVSETDDEHSSAAAQTETATEGEAETPQEQGSDEGADYDEDSLDPNTTNEIPRIEEPTEEDLANATPEEDFSGLEFSGFIPETEGFGDSDAGDTLKMPAVGPDTDSKQTKAFVAPANAKDARKQKKEQAKEARRQKKAAKEQAKTSNKTPVSKNAKIAISALAALLVVAAIGVTVSYQMEMWGGKTIPDVVGMTQTDATYLLESKGFKVRSTQVESDDTEGLVLLADPSSGARECVGSEVVIHVAVSRTIPQIEGKSESDAMAALKDAGFENIEIQKQKSDEEAGKIVSVEPAVGEKAKSTARVVLTETEPYTVPTVAGKTWEEAKQLIENEGFVSGYAEEYSETATSGTVLYSTPEEGSDVKSGSTITLVVAKSRGAELVAQTKQNLLGYTTTAANGQAVTITNVSYAQYDGNGWVSFTATGSYSVTVSVGSTTQTVTSDGEELVGYALYDSANNMTNVTITG